MTRGGMDQPPLQTQEDVQMEAVDDDADAAYCGGGWPERLRDEVADLEARVLPDYMTVFQEGIDHLKRGSSWNDFGTFIREGANIVASVGPVRDPLDQPLEGKQLKVGIFFKIKTRQVVVVMVNFSLTF